MRGRQHTDRGAQSGKGPSELPGHKGRSAGPPAAASDLDDAVLSLAREIRYAQRERDQMLTIGVGQEDAAVDDLDALAGARVQTALRYLKSIQASDEHYSCAVDQALERYREALERAQGRNAGA
jgi:hypothetical protein